MSMLTRRAAPVLTGFMLGFSALLGGCGSSSPGSDAGAGTPGTPIPSSSCSGSHVADGKLGDWIGTPGYISGYSRYSRGEYIYSDYIHDDAGANVNGVESGGLDIPTPITGIWFNPEAPLLPKTGSSGNSLDPSFRWSGDYAYAPSALLGPTGLLNYYDVADLIEFRAAADPACMHYYLRLGALKNADDAVVGIGIDADRNPNTGATSWPHGARMNQPLGYEYFITLWGSGGEITDYTVDPAVTTPVKVAVNLEQNVIEADVPRPQNSAGKIWRYYVGTGVWNRQRQQWAVPPLVDSDHLSATLITPTTPLIYDLAFQPAPEGNSWWRDNQQADDLARGSIRDEHADIDLAKLDADATTPVAQPTGALNIQYDTLPIDDGEGQSSVVELTTEDVYKSPRQPYMLFLPTDYWTKPHKRPLRWFFHCLNCNQNVFSFGMEADHEPTANGFNPKIKLGYNYVQSLVDAQDMVVVGVLQRGEAGAPNSPVALVGSGSLKPIEERDILDVRKTLMQRERVPIDDKRVVFSGMSMGGETTNAMMVRYPDWVAAATAYSAAVIPADWRSIRNVFYTHVCGDTGLDSTALIDGRGFASDLSKAGYAHFYMEFIGRAHDFHLVDESWPIIQGLIAPYVRDPNPAHVTFILDSAAEAPDLGITHTQAYWVSGLALADGAASGTVDLFADPLSAKLPTQASEQTGYWYNASTANLAYVDWMQYRDLSGRSLADFDPAWTPLSVTTKDVSSRLQFPVHPLSNGFEGSFSDLSAATLDLARMGINTARTISGDFSTSTPMQLSLRGGFSGAETLRVDGSTVAGLSLADGSYTLPLAAGTHHLEIKP